MPRNVDLTNICQEPHCVHAWVHEQSFLENSVQAPREIDEHTEVDGEVANRDGVAVKNATRIASMLCFLDAVRA